MCCIGTTNVKAKVLKDGHLFIVHIVDPQLEMGEEVPLSNAMPEWTSSADLIAEQYSGTL